MAVAPHPAAMSVIRAVSEQQNREWDPCTMNHVAASVGMGINAKWRSQRWHHKRKGKENACCYWETWNVPSNPAPNVSAWLERSSSRELFLIWNLSKLSGWSLEVLSTHSQIQYLKTQRSPESNFGLNESCCSQQWYRKWEEHHLSDTERAEVLLSSQRRRCKHGWRAHTRASCSKRFENTRN